MSLAAIISMILILGIVMGGFIYFLILAMRNEARSAERRAHGGGGTKGT